MRYSIGFAQLQPPRITWGSIDKRIEPETPASVELSMDDSQTNGEEGPRD